MTLKNLLRTSFVLFAIFSTYGVFCQGFQADPLPALYYGNPVLLYEVSVNRSKPAYAGAIERLMKEADSLLKVPARSVMDKEILPPSGDKHDYLTISTYRWPDTTKADGLPWIRLDGIPNTRAHLKTDRYNYSFMHRSMIKLALAYYFTGKRKYAKKAGAFIIHWYLADDFRMNPHFKYAQHIPGGNTGSFWGIIDGTFIIWVLDTLELIREASILTRDDDKYLREWLEKYYDWLSTSKFGSEERAMNNNHGSFYDLQASSLAWFLGKKEEAMTFFRGVKDRLNLQIDETGAQPEELARSRSFHYSVFNLTALSALAYNANRYGNVDLWGYPQAGAPKIKSGIEYILPAAMGKQTWPHKDIRFDPGEILCLLGKAKYVYPDLGSAYEELLDNSRQLDMLDLLYAY